MPLDTEFPTSIRCPGPSGDAAANDQDQLCEYGGFSYSYNARGQLESRSDGAVTTSYTYDGLGRLQRVTEPGMDLHYIHDALGRRIGKVRDGNLERGWLYADALNPIAELDGAGNVRATFLYGTRAHVPDAMVMADGTVYRFTTDHLGSVRLVVNAETGQVVQRMDYDAFGRVLNAVNPGFQPFGFAGGLYDDDTGLVRFGARDYDAHSGRWTAKDPVLFAGGDVNFYGYVGSDPINFIDPLGLWDFSSALGKIWASPTTAIGLALGGLGWAAGGQAPSFGNNAVEFRGNPLIAPFTPAVTIGNTICYASDNPTRATQDHERQHTYQAEALGPLYLAAHIASQAAGYGYSFFDSSQSYTSTNDRVHSPANLLEVGPMSTPPRPWP